jgi:hypothetical protein
MSPHMFSRLILTSVLASVTFTAGAAAQGAATDSQQPAGSWIGVISVPGNPFPPFRCLLTFGRDGTVIVSQATLVPMGGPAPLVFSAAHGLWRKTAEGQIAVKFVSLLHDTDAQFLGTAVMSGHLSINPGSGELTGQVEAADALPDGTVFLAFTANLAATRIRLD